MRILRASAHTVMPWKNGGGSTTEIAAFPDGAGLDRFDWRVSMAGVAEDGAFSRFPGVDRTLSVLSGDGIRLAVEGLGPVDLEHGSPPFAFPGDAATSSALLGGPITDLNVMTRRGRFTHRVEHWRTEAPCPVALGADVTIILSRTDGLALEWDGGGASLDRDDAVLFDALEGVVTVRPGGTAEFFVVALSAAEAR